MSYNRLSVVQFVKSAIIDKDGGMSGQFSKWFATGLIPAVNNTTPLSIPGPFANDAAAQAGGVPIGSAYFQATGAMVVRLV